MMFRIIAAIQAHDFIDQRPHPMTRSSNARITMIPPMIHPMNGMMKNIDPPIRENKPPMICNNANIVTPRGLSPEGAEYPEVGVGISAISLPSRVKGVTQPETRTHIYLILMYSILARKWRLINYLLVKSSA